MQLYVNLIIGIIFVNRTGEYIALDKFSPEGENCHAALELQVFFICLCILFHNLLKCSSDYVLSY